MRECEQCAMECPHCKSENAPDARTCDCGYDFRTEAICQSSKTGRLTAEETKRGVNSRTVWAVLGIAVLVSFGVTLSITPSHGLTWVWLWIGWGVVSLCFIWLLVKTRSKVAIIALVISVLACYFCFSEVVWWYE